MTIAAGHAMNPYALPGVMADKTVKKTNRIFMPQNVGQPFAVRFDSFISRANAQIMERLVKKMREAIARPATGLMAFPRASAGVRSGADAPAAASAPPAPEKWQIDLAVTRAGGLDALSPWLVEGKTKIDVGGRRMAATVTDSGTNEYEGMTERQQAERAIARFGFDASRLDGDLDQLRAELKHAAAAASRDNTHLAGAVEYALEDAFARVWRFESAGSEKPSAPGTESGERRDRNLSQADAIIRQLGLGESQAWGVQSLAEDFAVFGMDMTALSRNPDDLGAEIKARAQEMLADLAKRYTGSETDLQIERNRITGASARLLNGLRGSGGGAMQTASLSLSASVTVSVGGQRINASSIVAMSTVMVDPLVLDLNGDGINLKSAEEGVDFDMKGDGRKTRMGFIRGDDALLFIDSRGDGVAHDGRQLFGDSDGYANGFAKLAAYDDNGDGVIDELDAVFEQLRLWVEKTEDGVCEASETLSLREAGVKSINVGNQAVRADDGKGNVIGQVGTFTRTDGGRGLAADVWLNEKR